MCSCTDTCCCLLLFTGFIRTSLTRPDLTLHKALFTNGLKPLLCCLVLLFLFLQSLNALIVSRFGQKRRPNECDVKLVKRQRTGGAYQLCFGGHIKCSVMATVGNVFHHVAAVNPRRAHTSLYLRSKYLVGSFSITFNEFLVYSSVKMEAVLFHSRSPDSCFKT